MTKTIEMRDDSPRASKPPPRRAPEPGGDETMTKCTHEKCVEVDERGYTGPVSDDENPAARGCVTVTMRCCACGARRRENINGRHVEIGPWGPSLARRQEIARILRRRARDAIDRVRRCAECRDGVIAIDDDGFLITRLGEDHLSCWPTLGLAQAARRAALAAAAAEDDAERR